MVEICLSWLNWEAAKQRPVEMKNRFAIIR